MANDIALLSLGKLRTSGKLRITLFATLFVMFGTTLSYSGTGNASTSSNSDEFVYWARHSLKNNPRINSAYYEWQSAISNSEGAGSLPDPTVSFDYFIDEVQTRTGPQEYRLMLAQKFPWFGKRQIATEVAELKAQAALAKLESLRISTLQQLTNLWITGIHLAREIEISNEELNLLSQIERLALTRYRLAKASHPDLIRIQLKRSLLENNLGELERKRLDLVSKLERISDLPAQEDMKWKSRYFLPHIAHAASIKQNFEPIFQEALNNNPQFKLSRLQLAISEKQTEKIALKSRPDFTLRYGRIFTGETHNGIENSGEDPQYIGIGINIPLWDGKNTSELNAAKNSAQSLRLNVKVERNRIGNELKLELLRSNDLANQLSRYKDDLLPQAELALTTVLKSYQTGKSGFSDLIETEKLLLTLKREKNNLTKSIWLTANNIAALTTSYRNNPIQGL